MTTGRCPLSPGMYVELVKRAWGGGVSSFLVVVEAGAKNGSHMGESR